MLAAPGDASLVSVLGPGVISANPFLTGKTTGYVIDWAERKMGSRATSIASASAPIVRQIRDTSPEFKRYKMAIGGIVASVEAGHGDRARHAGSVERACNRRRGRQSGRPPAGDRPS